MKKIEIAAFHGWGFSQTCWYNLPGTIYRYDRGYFGDDKNQIEFSKNAFKVCITHSMGLHFVPQYLFIQIDLLIITSGFISFCNNNKHLRKLLKNMQNHLKINPIKVLTDFYNNCGYKQEIDVNKIQLDPLIQDLSFLENHSLQLNQLDQVPKTIILHGAQDTIVPMDRAIELSSIPRSVFQKVDNGGHALAFTHTHLLRECILKEIMKSNFSKSAASYNTVSSVQAKAACELFNLISQKNIPDGTILEIGAGTGGFSQKLIHFFKNKNLHITDISSEMLKFCQKHLEPTSNHLLFYELDAEIFSKNITTQKKYSCIVSSMAFQWVNNLEKVIEGLVLSLNDSGILAFSLLTSGSFKEWKEACLAVNVNFTANQLPDFAKLSDFVNNLGGKIKREIIVKKYPSAIDFFKTLKKLGADASLNFFTPGQMLRLIRSWKINEISYEVTYVVIEKNICNRH